jgi:hypothetical protein
MGNEMQIGNDGIEMPEITPDVVDMLSGEPVIKHSGNHGWEWTQAGKDFAELVKRYRVNPWIKPCSTCAKETALVNRDGLPECLVCKFKKKEGE